MNVKFDVGTAAIRALDKRHEAVFRLTFAATPDHCAR
jgi:hypothetical protein